LILFFEDLKKHMLFFRVIFERRVYSFIYGYSLSIIMIQIQDYSGPKVVRAIADMIEPLILAQVRKDNHTFFAYRCSDYNDFNHLISCHQFDVVGIKKLVPLLELYWTSIDLILFKIIEMPDYDGKKGYFDELRALSLKKKTVVDVDFFEVKMHTGDLKPMLAVNTFACINSLKELGKEMKVVMVKLDGRFKINYSFNLFERKNFFIKTHYGRKGYSLKLG